MIAAARRNGFVAIELAPNLSDLLAEIAAGNPVVVLQNLALDWYPAWHYAVAIGYDLKASASLCARARSGAFKCLSIPSNTPGGAAAIGRSRATAATPAGERSCRRLSEGGGAARKDRPGRVGAGSLRERARALA